MASDNTSSHPIELQSVQALWVKVTILESKFDSFAAEIRQALTQLIATQNTTPVVQPNTNREPNPPAHPLDPPLWPLYHPASSDDDTICRDRWRPIRPNFESDDDFNLLDRQNARFGAPPS